MRRAVLWGSIPLVVLTGLVVFFALGMDHNPRAIPSPLINKPVPSFSLTTLDNPGEHFGSAQLQGKVALVNIFASWCVSCTDETQTLDWLSKHGVTIYGIDYADTRPKAKAWLRRWGDPYKRVIFDPHGDAAVDWGIWGVPETFLVDAHGRIRRKFTGVITRKAAEKTVLPLIRKLEAGA